jgi:hypothetical protein
MTEEIFAEDKSEFDIWKEQMVTVLTEMANKFESRLQEVEKSIENTEKQVATLVIGYGEQAVFMEALLGQLSFASTEAQESFAKTLASARKEMLKIMKEGADGLLGDSEKDLASAIKNMADQKLSDTGKE